jgi:hypothetical protein
MELSDPPHGPIADERCADTPALENTLFEDTVDCLAERLLSTSSPLPEAHNSLFEAHAEQLGDLQREVWFCHWGVVVTLCVYQQLISHVDISVREGIAHTLGTFLAEGQMVDHTQLYKTIQAEFTKHGITLKPDMDLIHKELSCTALHSTVVCYIRDIALNMHAARKLGVESSIEKMFPYARTCVGRNFFVRFARVSSALLDIVYDVFPQIKEDCGPA